MVRPGRGGTGRWLGCGVAVALLAFAAPASAQDGRIEINQASALAGIGTGTGTDAPGYPVTITQSGSYVLTGDLQVTGTVFFAIQITAANVTLDLGGHTIAGPATAATVNSACIEIGTDNLGVVIRNGMLQPNGYWYGVKGASGSSGALGGKKAERSAHLEGLTIQGDQQEGIYFGDSVSSWYFGTVSIERCRLTQANSAAGGGIVLFVRYNSVVRDCMIRCPMDKTGVFTGVNATRGVGILIEGNVLEGMDSSGTGTATGIGIRVMGRSQIEGNTVRGFQGAGIWTGAWSQVRNNSVEAYVPNSGSPSGIGVEVGNGSLVFGNTISRFITGIVADNTSAKFGYGGNVVGATTTAVAMTGTPTDLGGNLLVPAP